VLRRKTCNGPIGRTIAFLRRAVDHSLKLPGVTKIYSMSNEPSGDLTDLKADLSDGIAQAHEIAVNFRSELEVADTFLHVAQTSSNYETAHRSLRNAWLALKAVEEFAQELELDFSERRVFSDLYMQ